MPADAINTCITVSSEKTETDAAEAVSEEKQEQSGEDV